MFNVEVQILSGSQSLTGMSFAVGCCKTPKSFTLESSSGLALKPGLSPEPVLNLFQEQACFRVSNSDILDADPGTSGQNTKIQSLQHPAQAGSPGASGR